MADGTLSFYRRYQAVAALGNRLYDPRLPSIVKQRAPQLGDRAGQNVFRNERVRPDSFENYLFGYRLATGPGGKAHQNLHHLWLQANRGAILGDGVQVGLDQPNPQTEVAIQGCPLAPRSHNYNPTVQLQHFANPSAKPRWKVSASSGHFWPRA